MALEVEDGTGRADAESVLSVDGVDAMAVREGWVDWPAAGQQVPAKEAALRKANRWAESRYGARLRSSVASWVAFYALPLSPAQARLFPMSSYAYPDGRTLTAGAWLPREWALVVGLAARRAFLGTLSPDLKRGGQVIQKVVGPLSTTWNAGAPAETAFPEIDDAAAPLWRGVGVIAVKG